MSADQRTAYVVKVYPRFSETFIVTEILAREQAGEDLEIFALRPTTDTHFHAELARVKAPVTHLPRATKPSQVWDTITKGYAVLPHFADRFASLLELTSRLEVSEVTQGIELAIAVHSRPAEKRIDRLHAHFASSQARVARIAAVLTDRPYSVTSHAKDIFHESVDPWVLREVLHGADAVVAISAYNEAHLATIAPDAHVVRVANGLDLERFPYTDPEPVGAQGPLEVLAVGRLVEKKGFDVLLRAVTDARVQGLDLRLKIVGDGERREQLHALADELGTQVEWLGSRGQEEVKELLRSADVFAAPCVVGADGNADGLPTVLLEAMAVGTPCISTAVTGIPEVVRGTASDPETGVLLEPGDVDGLTDALVAVAAEDFPRVQVARAARALVEAEHDTTIQAARLSTLTGGTR